MSEPQTVAILGASPDPARYAFKASRLLRERGHRVIAVSARGGEIDGVEAIAGLETLAPGSVDTLTVYVRPSIAARQREQILRLAPGRVIFNPGTESPRLAAELMAAGIPCLEDCTLVLLRTGRF